MINKELEFKILKFFLSDINLFRNDLPHDFFAHEDTITFYNFLSDYVRRYHALPTTRTIQDLNNQPILLLYTEIMNIEINLKEFDFYTQQIHNNFVERGIYNIGQLVVNGLYNENGEQLRQNIISAISNIRNPFADVGAIRKQWYWEDARNRWEQFKLTEANPNAIKGIPWGIEKFDEITNGAHPRWLVCFFAQAKQGKSKTMASLAFNQAVLHGADVMWVAREMDLVDMNAIFDSRYALIEQIGIRRGKLPSDSRQRYLKTLKEVYEKKPSLYIVDIPYACSPTDIENALLEYRSVKGKFPQVVYIDYANLMIPSKKYGNTSERYNFLFEELHELVRKYNICGVTAVQEGREGAKVKDKEEIGNEHIGLSHYIVPHVEMMIHLHQKQLDTLVKALQWTITASRHTPLESFSTFALMELNYIGDRRIV